MSGDVRIPGGEGNKKIDMGGISPDGIAAMKSIKDALGEMYVYLANVANDISENVIETAEDRDLFGMC